MTKTISLSILVGGIALLFLGFNSYDLSGSGISRLFTVSATETSLWFFGGGAAVSVLGVVGLSRKSTLR